MASQVLSGTGNVSYTNNTGQNVRIVINFMQATTGPGFQIQVQRINLSWGNNASASAVVSSIGRNLAYTTGSGVIANNASYSGTIVDNSVSGITNTGLPTELMLAPGQTFSASCGAYNIVVIPEAG